MPCDNCSTHAPGKMISVTDEGLCAVCEMPIVTELYGKVVNKRWDAYFHTVCKAISSKSPCISRQIGAILVRDRSIISTGYNGPARGFPHCEGLLCPRKTKGYKSGEGLEHCPASHAEMNCIANASRIGSNTLSSTLYMNSIIPCKFCAVILVNAGVKEVVVEKLDYYHEMSGEVFVHGSVKIRSFNI